MRAKIRKCVRSYPQITLQWRLEKSAFCITVQLRRQVTRRNLLIISVYAQASKLFNFAELPVCTVVQCDAESTFLQSLLALEHGRRYTDNIWKSTALRFTTGTPTHGRNGSLAQNKCLNFPAHHERMENTTPTKPYKHLPQACSYLIHKPRVHRAAGSTVPLDFL